MHLQGQDPAPWGTGGIAATMKKPNKERAETLTHATISELEDKWPNAYPTMPSQAAQQS